MARPPSAGAIANRRLLTFILAAVGILTFLTLASKTNTTADYSEKYRFASHSKGNAVHESRPGGGSEDAVLAYAKTPIHHVEVDKETLAGGAIMPKLGNETLKAELGRAAWKLFHTTMARFPEKPNKDEQTALFSYIHLFARLYPCGECAGHFRQILEKYPPQVSGRNRAAGWACFVHNEVNQSLGKPEFDCNNIGDFYDCGCAEDDESKEKKGHSEKAVDKASSGDKDTNELVKDSTKRPTELKLEREGKTLGG